MNNKPCPPTNYVQSMLKVTTLAQFTGCVHWWVFNRIALCDRVLLMIGSLVFTIVLNVVTVRFICGHTLWAGSVFFEWFLCVVLRLSLVPIWHVFEDLDHFPKISDDSPNIIAGMFYECMTMFSELKYFRTLPTTSEAGRSEILYRPDANKFK